MDLFFSFNGRINRAKWWLGVLGLFIVQWVLWLVLGSAFGLAALENIDSNDPTAVVVLMQQMSAMMVPMGILILVMIYPSLAVHTKRWHDRNKSGWWSLIMLIPMVGALWVLIELGILRGTDGENRYGPDPLM